MEAEKLGGGEKQPLFLPTPPFYSVCRRGAREGCGFLCLSFRFFFLCDLLGAHLLSLGIGLGSGQTSKGCLQRVAFARTRMGNPDNVYPVMIYMVTYE